MERVRFLEFFSGIGGMRYAFFYALRTHLKHFVSHTRDSTNSCRISPSYKSFGSEDGPLHSAEEAVDSGATRFSQLSNLTLDYVSIDINNMANEVLEYNVDSFGARHKIITLDINAIDLDFLNNRERFHVCTMSPPCQPYSRRSPSELKGSHNTPDDGTIPADFSSILRHTEAHSPHGHLFTTETHPLHWSLFTIEDILKRIKGLEETPNFDGRRASILRITRLILHTDVEKLPLYILLENIKEFYYSVDYKLFIAALTIRGYKVLTFRLSTLQFGFPNERTRLYITAKLDDYPEHFGNYGPLDVITDIPKSFYKSYGINEDLVRTPIEEFIDEANDVSDSGFNIPESILACRKSLSFDILYKHRKCRDYTMCFTKNYGRFINGTGSVWCFADVLDDTSTNENLVAYNNSIRYFSPVEVARLMGFKVDGYKFAFVPFKGEWNTDDDYESLKFPKDLSNRQLYGLLGNSLNPQVVAILFLATGLQDLLWLP